MKPVLSIVILYHNDSPDTLRCLDSLRPVLTARDDIEIVLVNNGATPLDTTDIPRISHVTLDTNRGVAAGRNAGLSAANPESSYLMLLDNDTVVTPEAVEALIRFMDDNPAVGLAAPALISADGSVQASAKPYPGIFRKVRNLVAPRDKAQFTDLDTRYPCYVIGACQIFRAETFREVGPLDENIFYGPEDADFCIRIRKSGAKVAYVPSVRITHLWQRATRRSLFSPLSRRHIAALFYFYKKHRRWL